MGAIKTLLIVLAVVLAVAIGYSLYLHFGPIQQISDENKQFKDEIARLRIASEESRASYETAVNEKTRKISDLEKALSQVQQEKTATGADFQEQIQRLKEHLAQRDHEMSTSRNEIETLQRTIADLKGSQERLGQKSADLSNQLAESKNQLEGLHQQMEVKERELSEMTKARQGLIEQVALLKEEKQGLGQKAIALEKQLAQSREQVHSVSQTVASKENQLRTIAKTQAELEKQLQQQIEQKNLQISALEDKLKIQLLDKILFNPGNAVITPDGRNVLKNLASELKKLQGIQISVEGHTDDQPLSQASGAVYHDNLGLSVARAAAVSRTLRTLGVDPKLLSAAGYSMYRPIAGNETPEGQQLNRRVEIILLPSR
jgi:chemotaxis protein MotB